MSGKKIITGLQEAIAMTDRNELVARLRGFATDRDGSEEVSADARPYLHDAADRIEQDAATIARLMGEVASWRMASTEAEKEVAAVRAQRASAEAQVTAMVRHLEAVLAIAERNERGVATDAARAAIAAAKEGA